MSSLVQKVSRMFHARVCVPVDRRSRVHCAGNTTTTTSYCKALYGPESGDMKATDVV